MAKAEATRRKVVSLRRANIVNERHGIGWGLRPQAKALKCRHADDHARNLEDSGHQSTYPWKMNVSTYGKRTMAVLLPHPFFEASWLDRSIVLNPHQNARAPNVALVA